ncbi:MAG TPA: TlpA disulfide reductase family protein [Candidatus Limnocylindria bacterium]|nr:TlpA disulfide reductase family protein [Candidatus Limnocylindria bacterium]
MLLALAGGAEAAPAAPGFLLHLLDGTPFDSRHSIGKEILVLRFQASYCKPCARESAALNRVAERYKDRGVRVIAIHVQDTVRDVRAFARAQKATYTIGLDPRLTVGNRFGFHGTPYTVVIDRDGEIVANVHGLSAVARLPKTLDELLAKP